MALRSHYLLKFPYQGADPMEESAHSLLLSTANAAWQTTRLETLKRVRLVGLLPCPNARLARRQGQSLVL